MITMSGEQYEKKCHKVAAAYANIIEAHEKFVNFLTAIGDIDLDDEELGPAASDIGGHLIAAKKLLEDF